MQRLLSGNYFRSPFLILNLNLLNAYSTTAASSSSHCFANYLVDSLGFSHQQALSTSTRLYLSKKVFDFKFVDNASSVLTFFKSHGFNDTHLRKIVSCEPKLLCSNVDITLLPKFKFLLNQGFSGSDLTHIISMNPILLSSSLDSSISPALDILRRVMGCDALVIAVFKRLYRDKFSTICNNLMPNVALLTSYGIPIELIRKHLVQKPVTYVRNPEVFKDMVVRVEQKLGILPDSLMFLYGVDLVSGYSEEAIESKCRMFKSFGWTQTDVNTFMMKIPCCFSFSDETIKKKLDFLMNELRLKPDYLISNNVFFTCSLEKRIVPRHKVLLILKEKGLLEKNPSLGRAIRMSESRFLEMFVIPFKEVHDVYFKLTGCSMKMLTQLKACDVNDVTT